MSYFYFSSAIGYNDVPQMTTLNIYTVGCIHKCDGCHCPDLQDFNKKDRKELDTCVIDKLIKRSIGLIKGVCWLGGDPLFQKENIIPLLSYISVNYPQLCQIIYTGYTFEGFHNDFKKQLISSGVNYIIDGKFNGYVLGDDLCNQRIYEIKNKSTYQELSYDNFYNKITNVK